MYTNPDQGNYENVDTSRAIVLSCFHPIVLSCYLSLVCMQWKRLLGGDS